MADGTMTLQTTSRLTLGLGVLSVLAILAASMALQDIYHGEPDLTREWRMLRVSFLIVDSPATRSSKSLTAAWKGSGLPDDRS
jgi:hypothetical protein